jgi:hypothetical protein
LENQVPSGEMWWTMHQEFGFPWVSMWFPYGFLDASLEPTHWITASTAPRSEVHGLLDVSLGLNPAASPT